MNFQRALLSIVSILFLALSGCGTANDANKAKKTDSSSETKHKHDRHHDHDHHHDHHHDHDHRSHDISLANNICSLEKSNMADFSIKCPIQVRELRFGFMGAATVLIFNMKINGVHTRFSIKKAGQNGVIGSIDSHDIEIEIILENGAVEIIKVP